MEKCSSSSVKKKIYYIIRSRLLDWDILVKNISKLAKRNDKILDLGCGNGLFSFNLAHKLPNCTITGYDLNAKRIEYLNQINDCSNLKFTVDKKSMSSRYQIYVCVDLLHHVSFEQQEFILKRIYDNMTSNTYLVVKEMDGKLSINYFFNLLIDLVSARQYPLFYRNHSEWKMLLAKMQYKIVKSIDTNKKYIPLNHICFILKKL